MTGTNSLVSCRATWIGKSVAVTLLKLRRLLWTRRGTHRGVPVVLGFFLLAAAGLKTLQLLANASAESGIFTSRLLLIGLIELELALGVCLLLGVYPRQVRLVALISFTAFAAVSLQQALAGRASCCCFGALAVRPWYTFVFDLAAVAALWHWPPQPNICSGEQGVTSNCSLPLFSIMFGLLFIPAAILAIIPGSHAPSLLLAVTPDTIDMGNVQAGSRKDLGFSVTNPGLVPVTVARIETSCPCLKLELPPDIIAPGQTVAGHARIDLANEAAFTGALGIEAKCVTASGDLLFAVIVKLIVQGG